jgi:hypothetical protein
MIDRRALMAGDDRRRVPGVVDFVPTRSSCEQGSDSMPGASSAGSRLPLSFRRNDMRVMVMVKATPQSEAGVMPSEQLLTEMGQFNEALAKAGILLAGEGLQPSAKGVRVRFSGKARTVVDGPFAETKELVAGFWLWQVHSMDEAIEWIKRCPNPHPGDAEIEIRQVLEAEDFGAEFTPELREQEARLRAQAAARK